MSDDRRSTITPWEGGGGVFSQFFTINTLLLAVDEYAGEEVRGVSSHTVTHAAGTLTRWPCIFVGGELQRQARRSFSMFGVVSAAGLFSIQLSVWCISTYGVY